MYFLESFPIFAVSSYISDISANMKMQISYTWVLYLNDNYLMFLIGVSTWSKLALC